ncbi:MAG TPA: hypothetical protein ENL09_00350, partial [Bacteroidetes bacterium]|nr:hypothetical protein [Bacteroidota bacterium]
MTVAELIATLALDFEDQASAKASKAAQALEASLKSINIEGAIKGDPFSNTYKYINAFRKQFRTLAQDISSGLDLGISGKRFLPGIKTLIKNIENVHSHYAEAGVALGNLNKLIDVSTSLYHKYGKAGVEENDKIQSSLSEVASRMEEVKATLLNVKLSPQLSKELRGEVIPSIDRMIEALKLGDDTSKTAFLKAVENLQKLDFSSKAALTGLKQLIQEFDLLNKKTEQFYSTRNIKAVPVEQLGGAYSGILEKLGRARAELSKTLGLIKSEFQYVPRMAESVRNQIISLAKAGYDLSATEVRNIKQVVQYRDIELQALQVKANLLRAGLVSDREAISLIQQASNYAQKYNLSLKEVLNTLNLSTKDWASFYASSIKSKSGLTQIRSELDIINNLISAGISGNKAITTEIMANLRARQKELQIEEQIINIENQRISTLANMVRYYELMAKKSRLALSSRMQEDLKGALRVLAEINTQLEGQYNIESNLSKLRQLIASSYAKDLNASKLIEASGLKREQIERAIATAREQSIKSLQLQYQLG